MAVKKKTEKTEEKMTFEEAYEKLEQAANAIMSDYDMCSRILEDAEQLIQIYDKETDTVKEFQGNE